MNNISGELINIINMLNKQGKMFFVKGATSEQIDRFENDAKTKLPGRYKEWLLFSDGGDLFLPAGVQLYGVAHKPLIDLSNNDRPDDTFVVIGSLASGDPILFKKDSEKIMIYNHEAGRIEDDEIYDDFYAFLVDLPNILGIED